MSKWSQPGLMTSVTKSLSLYTTSPEPSRLQLVAYRRLARIGGKRRYFRWPLYSINSIILFNYSTGSYCTDLIGKCRAATKETRKIVSRSCGVLFHQDWTMHFTHHHKHCTQCYPKYHFRTVPSATVLARPGPIQ